MIRVALAGNPNCGKTTLFNALTGSKAYVGNWPGVTVEKRSGTYYSNKKKKEGAEIVDLPGIYSLSPFTSEETIARNYIINERPDVIISVIDGTNLERNLYLATQILETDIPVVVAVNMADLLKENGTSIDYAALSDALGVPVVPVSALKSKGLDKLMAIAMSRANKERKGLPAFADDKARYAFAEKVCSTCLVTQTSKRTKSDKIDKLLTHRWLSLPFIALVLFLIFHLVFGSDLLFLGAMGVNFGSGYEGFLQLTIDGEVFTPFEGLFWTADGINSPGEILHVLAGDSETGVLGCLSLLIKQGLINLGSPDWVIGFFYDGVLSGIAAVLGFVPQIMLLFLFFSIMEDSGYMARISFVLDRIFHKFGVSGRAFLPMIMGFGCSVPAMMNTRTLGSDKEKTKTLRVIPFFTCGAKAEFLVTIAAAVAAVVGFDAGAFTFLVYAFGVIVAFVAVIIMSKTTQKEATPPFIMELPPYHVPSFRSLMIHVWDRGKHFIEKAFTIILISTIAVWFLASFGWDSGKFGMIESGSEGSILYYIGTGISYLFTPLGFGAQVQHGAWAFSVASIQGVIAKENVTAVLETLSANVVGAGASFEDFVNYSGITTAGLIGFTVFNMMTIPCFASIGAAKGESVNKKTFWMTILYWVAQSYILGMAAYLIFEYVWPLAIIVPLAAIAVFLVFYFDKKKKERA